MEKSKNAVLVFARMPEKGKVKKRLAADLGEDAALELYRAFVDDLLNTLARSGLHHIICHTPKTIPQALAPWPKPDLPRFPQTGADLGERMAHAFEHGFSRGFRRLVLVGTDIPDLPESAFHQAFAALETGPAVVGPARDGGYYLIGFSAKGFDRGVFKDIQWGTGRVLEQTLDRFRALGKKVRLLFSWNDIDTMADLKQYIGRYGSNPTRCTMAVLARLDLIKTPGA